MQPCVRIVMDQSSNASIHNDRASTFCLLDFAKKNTPSHFDENPSVRPCPNFEAATNHQTSFLATMASDVTVYKKVLVVVENWNNCGLVYGSAYDDKMMMHRWFPEALFTPDCLCTFNNGPTGVLCEPIDAFKLEPMCMTFAVESISTCAGAWARIKVHSTCADGQNLDNSVSYPPSSSGQQCFLPLVLHPCFQRGRKGVSLHYHERHS
jgi:hypothetical protein